MLVSTMVSVWKKYGKSEVLKMLNVVFLFIVSLSSYLILGAVKHCILHKDHQSFNLVANAQKNEFFGIMKRYWSVIEITDS